ncbi:hypothetical protein V1525DRAFT_360810 [Lipomyces kononenkoae]|uniref:Uncharacterized protein n=1 Tax=Lipomyces kononenkoae TaxID=34357 RepID=A0ACC3T1F8_LIPKO
MPSELEELVEFLHSPQAMIRNIALQHLVGYSTTPQKTIFLSDNCRPIKDLKTIARDTPKIAKDALTVLANMSEFVKIRAILAEDLGFLEFVITSITKPQEPNADLFCILLANIAKDNAISNIFKLKASKNRNEHLKSDNILDQLMDCFVKGAEKKLNKYATFDYLAFAFADISRLPEGRKYFVTEQEYDGVVPLSKLLVFTEYNNALRRAGVASTIKNSLFELPEHITLLDKDRVNILPYLLLPLAGPEELSEDEMFELPDELQLLPPDKQREDDHEILRVHVESLVLLGSTRYGRDFMRNNGVYPLVRELHLAIENDDVREICERFVQLIMADEPGEAATNQRLQITEAAEEEEVSALEAL